MDSNSSPRSGSPGRPLYTVANSPGLPVTSAAIASAGLRSRLDVSESQGDDSSTAIEDPAVLSNGSSEHMTGVDEPESQNAKYKAAIHQIRSKISSTKNKIKEEQTTRDDNVNEYLRLAANADKQQIQRIKSVFEKKNQKSAQIIAQLQKKLEVYNKRIRDLEAQRGASSSSRQPREVLRGMGHGLKHVGGNIRDGISGFSGGVVENIKGGLHGAAETVMAKPREFAHLIKNRFGSADNINALSRGVEGGVRDGVRDGSDEGVERGSANHRHGSATLPNNCTLSSSKYPSDDGSACSSVTSESGAGAGSGGGHNRSGMRGGGIVLDPTVVTSLEAVFQELHDRRDEIELLKEKLEAFKEMQKEVQTLNHLFQEEKFRSERLEEQINDLTELHQNEVENLKQTLTDMEEKVQYQSEERLRDIHEILEACQTKISKMEHQQQQHQQYVTLEGLDNGNARALVVKLINVLLTVLQVVLLLVATVAGIIMPFFKTRLRFVSTLALIASFVFVLKQWPELADFGANLLNTSINYFLYRIRCFYHGSLKYVNKFFKLLKKLKIDELKICDWLSSEYTPKLCVFIASLPNVKSIRIENTLIGGRRFFKFLQVCLNHSLESFALHGGIAELIYGDAFTNQFVEDVWRLKNLSNLHIEAAMLSDGFLESIRNLESLQILHIRSFIGYVPVCNDYLWSCVCKKCPKFRVAYHIKRYTLTSLPLAFLKPSMPVCSFRLSVTQTSQSFEATQLLNSLKIYSDTLELIDLNLKSKIEFDDILLDFIITCRKLQYIRLNIVINRSDILMDIAHYLNENNSSRMFRFWHIRPRFIPNLWNPAILNNCSQIAGLENIRFNFENPNESNILN